jgi:hypothetical protein
LLIGRKERVIQTVMLQRKTVSAGKTVPCARCLKEVPISEAGVAEAVDYVAYFCGLECYAKWAEHEGASSPRLVLPAAKNA